MEVHCAAPVFAVIAVRVDMFRVEKSQAFAIEACQDAVAANFPIKALEQHHEIVPADVSHKIELANAAFPQDAGQKLNHVITLPKSVDVVIGFELVEIEIGCHKSLLVDQQALEVLLDRHISGQAAQRIGITGSDDLHVGDLAHQIKARPDAQIPSIGGDDEPLGKGCLAFSYHLFRKFGHGCGFVDDQRVGIHKVGTRFFAMEFTSIEADKAIEQGRAVNHAHRNSVIHNRHGMQVRMLHHQFKHLFAGSRWRDGGCRHDQPARRKQTVAFR